MVRFLLAVRMIFVCAVILAYLIVVGIPTIILCQIFRVSLPALRLTQLLDYIVLFLGGIHKRLDGFEKIDRSRGYVYVANHRSFAEPAVLLNTLPGKIHFLAKKEVFKIPLVGAALSTMGMIEINRGNREEASRSVQRAAEKLQKGESVVFFPEGTRNRGSEPMLPFKKGAFVLAIAAQAPIFPITVVGGERALKAGTLQLRGGTMDIIFHDPIETRGMTYEDRDRLLEMARAAIGCRLPAPQ